VLQFPKFPNNTVRFLSCLLFDDHCSSQRLFTVENESTMNFLNLDVVSNSGSNVDYQILRVEDNGIVVLQNATFEDNVDVRVSHTISCLAISFCPNELSQFNPNIPNSISCWRYPTKTTQRVRRSAFQILILLETPVSRAEILYLRIQRVQAYQ
jgi:hypothetical protein